MFTDIVSKLPNGFQTNEANEVLSSHMLLSPSDVQILGWATW